MKLLARLDYWWEHRHTRRHDRGPVYVCVMIAMWCFSLSAVLSGPNPASSVGRLLDVATQDLMALCILLGSSVCLYGIASGSRWFRRTVPLHRCYFYSLIGMPSLSIGLAVYGGAVAITQPTPLAALAGVLGPLIAVGDAVQGTWLWLESRRIQRNIKLVQAIDNGCPLPEHVDHPPKAEPPPPTEGKLP